MAQAYARGEGTIRFELVTRALLAAIPDTPQRIVDVGGGYGRQAILLARAGHVVTIIDFDSNMLAMAEQMISKEDEGVRARIDLVLGCGEDAPGILREEFDAVCCHSVLMYVCDPKPILSSLSRLTRSGGVLSILSINAQATAMRSGLQGRWLEAIASLQAGESRDGQYFPNSPHLLESICAILEQFGVKTIGWHGVGIFTDHLVETLTVADPAQVIMAEWLAGNMDPYRGVARCFHLLARRN